MSEIIIEEMTEEDFNRLLIVHNAKAAILEFESGQEMDNFKVDAAQGMIRFGGSFASHLGRALAHADSDNTFRLIRAFPEMCHEHAKLYRDFLNK